ncbi:MAG TPA: hypothetical protein DD471_08410 [Planctomycetes bacterium]|nr:hypothetical protein [Planctomycetota bacterium]
MHGRPLHQEGGSIQSYSTFYFFSTALAVGSISILPLVPASLFGRRFFLLAGLIAILFFVFALVSRGLAMEPLYLCSMGFLILYEITIPAHPEADHSEEAGKPRSMHRTSSILMLAMAILAAWSGLARESLEISAQLHKQSLRALDVASSEVFLLNSASSALLLGFSLISMILGHWYLVSRKLSFQPLKLISGLLCLAVAVRALVIVIAVFEQGEYWGQSFSGGFTHYLLSGGLFVACRLSLGVILPAILAVLAWRCAKLESNQSATGILYVLVAFVFFGEILSKHFLANQGLVL